MISKEIILYPGRTDVTLTTYIWADSVELLDGDCRPAVLICPGGGYLGCSDREAEPIALRFAAMGYHAFVLRYSTYWDEKNGYIVESGKEQKINERSIFPKPMQDIGKAMLCIHEHADEWLVDTDKIVLCGFSAGAHNCAMYSVYWDKKYIAGYFKEEPVLFRPAALILGYAVIDYGHWNYEEHQLEKRKHLDAFNIAYMGKAVLSDEEKKSITPSEKVNANTPPAFLWATADDELVPVEHTLRMSSALAANKVPFEVHIFEKGQHGLSLANQASGDGNSFINEDVAQWVLLAEKFLNRRMKLGKTVS